MNKSVTVMPWRGFLQLPVFKPGKEDFPEVKYQPTVIERVGDVIV